MSPVALDGTKLIILMGAGGVFTLAGIWLMFRPPTRGEAAKIELFGLKFQSSSAGLLVFLIGAVFLGVPVFVPEKTAQLAAALPSGPVESPARSSADPGDGETAGVSATAGAASAAPIGRPGQQFAVHADEIEPNDSHGQANIVAPGTALNGTFVNTDRDHFCMDIPQGTSGTLVVTLSGFSPVLELVDDVGVPIAREAEFYNSATVVAEAPIERNRYCAVAATDYTQERGYHLSVAVRPE